MFTINDGKTYATAENSAFSFGGGVQSTAALVLASQGQINYKRFVFSNVGRLSENPETLEYIEKYSKPFASASGIEIIEVCKRNRAGRAVDLYTHLLKPQRSIDIPVRTEDQGKPGNRHCTLHWKTKVVGQWAKQNNIRLLGLGISIDEIHRVRSSSRYEEEFGYKHNYCLIDLGLSRQDCLQIINDAGLPPPPKSSCWFCPYKTLEQWRYTEAEHPDLFKKAIGLEKTLSERAVSLSTDKKRYTKRYMTAAGARGHMSLADVLKDKQLSLLEQDLDNCDSGYCWV